MSRSRKPKRNMWYHLNIALKAGAGWDSRTTGKHTDKRRAMRDAMAKVYRVLGVALLREESINVKDWVEYFERIEPTLVKEPLCEVRVLERALAMSDKADRLSESYFRLKMNALVVKALDSMREPE